MNYKNLLDMFLQTYNKNSEKLAFVYRVGSSEYSISYKQVLHDVITLSLLFKKNGMKKGDKIMFVSDNRYEWIITDLAVISIGAILVPRGIDTPCDELSFILEDACCSYLILEHEKTYAEYKEMLKKHTLKSIFVIESIHNKEYYSYKEETDKITISKENEEHFFKQVDVLDAQDTFTIIYTSGTTGKPKGVMLSHKNMIYNIDTIPHAIRLVSDDVWVSILPSWHVFERAAEYVAISKGCTIIYSSIKTFSADLEKYKPTMVATVPRLWESMYTKINAKLSQDPKKAAIFYKLVDISKTYKHNMRILKDELPVFEKESLTSSVLKKSLALSKIILLYPLNVFAKKKLSLVQKKFGGRLKLAISGGGALPLYIEEWIDALDIRIVNSYGMTETSPLIAGRGLDCNTFATLGPAFKGTSLRIVNEQGIEVDPGIVGSLEVKGPQVMQGYFNNEEENKKNFTKDDYLKTGDLGKFTIKGELILTGRLKEIIVLANGENVDPSRIESAISIMPFINDSMLIGQDKKGLGLLIVPDVESLKDFIFKKFDKVIESVEHLKEDKHILNSIKKELNELLHKKHGFKAFEKLQNIHFLEKEFKMGEELTNTLKKKRHIIEVKYKELIDKILK